MELVTAKPLRGGLLNEIQQFLAGLSLTWEPACETTVCLLEEGWVVATGSRQGGVLKCLGVQENRQGEGLAAKIVTALVADAAQSGYTHLFLYTKPQNLRLFLPLGFFPVTQTKAVALLENEPQGVGCWVEGLRQPQAKGRVGCIVANCNPFTYGHRYLAQKAAERCDFVYFLVLSEEKGLFPAKTRLRLAREGLADLKNVQALPTGPYLVSAATFPDYFIKEKAAAQGAYYDLDIAVFLQWFVPLLGIKARFVGTEPGCPVTNGYNARLAQLLPTAGVELYRVERLAYGGAPVSASTVRALMERGDRQALDGLVPPSTLKIIERMLRHERPL